MKIGIDLTSLLPKATGIDKYLKNMILHLGKIDQSNRYVIFLNYEDRYLFKEKLPDNFSFVKLCLRPRVFRLFFQQIILPIAALLLNLDVVHSPSFIMPFFKVRKRHVLTVYDMTFFSLPSYHIPLRRSSPFKYAVFRSIQKADIVCVPSYFVLKDIQCLIPKVSSRNIRVIYPGIEDKFKPQRFEETQKIIRGLGIHKPYILFVGTIEPRKNIKQLIDSYRQLVSKYKISELLVISGRLGWYYEEIMTQLQHPVLKDRVHLTGYTEEEHLPYLYAGARLFVYPSWQEGFGFPPLEAMASGVPTISSRTSSLSENLDGAAVLIFPDDSDALTEAMLQLLCDEKYREHYIRQGLERAGRFRWDKMAEQMKLCYEEIVKR